MKKKGVKRVGATAPIYGAAALEQMISDILSCAANHTKKANRKRVLPSDITMAIHSDENLSKLMRGFVVYHGQFLKEMNSFLPLKEK